MLIKRYKLSSCQGIQGRPDKRGCPSLQIRELTSICTVKKQEKCFSAFINTEAFGADVGKSEKIAPGSPAPRML